MTVICPNSTPILNEINAKEKSVFGKPISLRAFAKPKP